MALLAQLVSRLEKGDWVPVLRVLTGENPLGVTQTDQRRMRLLRLIALGMALRTLARFSDAEEVLRSAQPYAERDHAYSRLEWTPEAGSLLWAWRAVQVLDRELQELQLLRELAAGIPRGSSEILLAFVELDGWVESDPFLYSVRRSEVTELTGENEFSGFDGLGRLPVCRWATALRQFARSRKGTVTERTWDRMGGYRTIKLAAMEMLVSERVSRSLSEAEEKRFLQDEREAVELRQRQVGGREQEAFAARRARPLVRIGRQRSWERAHILMSDRS